MAKIYEVEGWIDLIQEEILDPNIEIIDPHHHLWHHQHHDFPPEPEGR